MTDMRTRFVETTIECLDNDPRTAVVLADISADQFSAAAERHPSRVLNVGIREQLMVSVGGGLALSGLTPVVHSYAPFLVERSFEQVKLDFGHQGAKGILVSVGASYDTSSGGRTHHAPEDVALIDTLPGWRTVVPGHADEVPELLRDAFHHEESTYLRLSSQSNQAARPSVASGELEVVRRGSGPLVVAVGPLLDSVLEASEGLDVTVAYASTVRPLDATGLRALAMDGEVVLVEPYLTGTTTRQVDEALSDRPHRTLSLGVDRVELRRYGTPADHAAAYGLDPAGLRRSISEFVTQP